MKTITQKLIKLALKEDCVSNDITTKTFIPKKMKAKVVAISNKDGVICGIDVFEQVYKTVSKKCVVKKFLSDGSPVKKGQVILEVCGPAQSILSGERVALNFLQHLSGIATFTNTFVKLIDNGITKIYDTRKTIPGYRQLAKYAVKCGGGANHRMSLADMVLIKDNHLSLGENLVEKINKFRKKHKNIKIEVECESISQINNALLAKADVIMLDNTNFENTQKMVQLIRNNSVNGYKPEIEVSGGVNINTAKEFSKLKVDRISVGMITHSAPALDITLETTLK